MAIIAALIQAKASVDVYDAHGMTPLMWAVKHDNSAIFNRLMDIANIDLLTSAGSVLHTAVECNKLDIIWQLLVKGARLDGTNQEGLTPLQLADQKKYADISKLLSIYKDFKETGENGFLPYLAKQKQLDFVYMAAPFFGVNSQDVHGFSALHHACTQGDVDMCFALIRLGANDRLKTKDALLPIDLAKQHNHHNVEALLAPERTMHIPEQAPHALEK